jgi:uncharacterized membrane protein YhaH (DUF805 family)
MSGPRSHVTHETRSKRSRREFWLKLGVWIFLFIFAFSVVGGIFVVGASLGGSR